jgi:hypothetical protein
MKEWVIEVWSSVPEYPECSSQAMGISSAERNLLGMFGESCERHDVLGSHIYTPTRLGTS